VFDSKRLKALLEERNELAANASTGSLHVTVGGVFTPRLAESLEIGAKGGSAEAEQGTDDVAGNGMDAGEPSEAGAAQHMGEDSFSLVVGGVRGGDISKVLFASDTREPFVPSSAPGVFQVALGAPGKVSDVSTRGMELESEARSELGNELLIGIRCAGAELVIEVENVEHDAQAFTGGVKQVE
jgi:hypothetical protein